MAEHAFKVGDRVSWKSHGGQAEGKIIKVATAAGSIEDFDDSVSKDDPHYIVETDQGKRGAQGRCAQKDLSLRIDLGRRCYAPTALTCQARAALAEIRSSSPMIRKLISTDEPPYEMNGSVMPVSGMTRKLPPTMIKV